MMPEPVHQPQPGHDSMCPICGGTAAHYLTKPARGIDWRIHVCGACGHGSVVNRPTLEFLAEIYASDQSHHPTPTEAPRDERIPFIERLSRLCALRGDSLDVGSGGGEFSLQLQRHGFRPVMTDLDDRAKAAASHIPHGEFHRVAFEEFTYPNAFAAIIMSQVLEHALDPVAWLGKARGMLAGGGVLGIALPNFRGVYRLMGRRDPFLIPPLHLNYFTRDSLRRAFERAGLLPLAFDSTSRLYVSRRPGVRGVAIRNAVDAWNIASRALDHTTRGVMLQGYARRDD